MAQRIDENSTWARSIRTAAECGTLGHAMILVGKDGAAAGRYIAAAHLCQEQTHRPCLRCDSCRKVMAGIHPDVIAVHDDEHKELSADDIRELRQDVYIRPHQGERKVYLFTDSAQLNERDQNILLKVIEEGPPYAVFLFCAATAHALLPTIRSRCTQVHLGEGAETPPEHKAAGALCSAVAQHDHLALAQAAAQLETRSLKREQLAALLQSLWCISAEALLYSRGGTGEPGENGALLCRSLDDGQLSAMEAVCRRYMDECAYNVGTGHVLGALYAGLDDIL